MRFWTIDQQQSLKKFRRIVGSLLWVILFPVFVIGRFFFYKGAVTLFRGRGTKAARMLSGLSLFWNGMDRRHRAVELAQMAVEEDPRSVRGYQALGFAYARSGEWGNARTVLEHAAELAPDDPWVWATLGQLALNTRQWADAETFYRRAIALKPNEPRYLRGLANAIISVDPEGSWEEYRNLVDRIYALTPHDAYALTMLSYVRHRRADLAGAEQAIREAIMRDSNYSHAHYRLARILLSKGQPTWALEAARRAAALNPDRLEYQALVRSLER